MRFAILIMIAIVVAGPVSRAEDIPQEQAEQMIREVLQSHIDGNVPAPAEFKSLLERDLRAYFSSKGTREPIVSYEMLRDGPTQTGIAYPKFYLWVRVESSSRQEGAVRAAAINRERFEILQYVDQAEAKANAPLVRSVFPPDVAEAILKRVLASGS